MKEDRAYGDAVPALPAFVRQRYLDASLRKSAVTHSVSTSLQSSSLSAGKAEVRLTPPIQNPRKFQDSDVPPLPAFVKQRHEAFATERGGTSGNHVLLRNEVADQRPEIKEATDIIETTEVDDSTEVIQTEAILVDNAQVEEATQAIETIALVEVSDEDTEIIESTIAFDEDDADDKVQYVNPPKSSSSTKVYSGPPGWIERCRQQGLGLPPEFKLNKLSELELLELRENLMLFDMDINEILKKHNEVYEGLRAELVQAHRRLASSSSSNNTVTTSGIS